MELMLLVCHSGKELTPPRLRCVCATCHYQCPRLAQVLPHPLLPPCPLQPTVLGLQLGAGLGCHQAGHEAVVTRRSGIPGSQGAWHGGAGAPEARQGGTGGRRGFSCGGQVCRLEVCVQWDAVKSDLGSTAGLALVLYGWGRRAGGLG